MTHRESVLKGSLLSPWLQFPRTRTTTMLRRQQYEVDIAWCEYEGEEPEEGGAEEGLEGGRAQGGRWQTCFGFLLCSSLIIYLPCELLCLQPVAFVWFTHLFQLKRDSLRSQTPKKKTTPGPATVVNICWWAGPSSFSDCRTHSIVVIY